MIFVGVDVDVERFDERLCFREVGGGDGGGDEVGDDEFNKIDSLAEYFVSRLSHQ